MAELWLGPENGERLTACGSPIGAGFPCRERRPCYSRRCCSNRSQVAFNFNLVGGGDVTATQTAISPALKSGVLGGRGAGGVGGVAVAGGEHVREGRV